MTAATTPQSAAELLARALASAPERPADPASEAILDAALELSAASGIGNLTMDAVAVRAGAGRMTVYRRFGDRRGLVEALAGREAARCLARMEEAVDPAEPVVEQVAQGFVASLAIARQHPLLSRMARFEPEVVLTALNANDGIVFTISRAFVADRIRAARRDGDVPRSVDPDHAAEILVRLAFSFVLIGESSLPLDDEKRSAEVARRLIAPILCAR